eukprot:Colp12_sorted_trinity150504_noHs@7025
MLNEVLFKLMNVKEAAADLAVVARKRSKKTFTVVIEETADVDPTRRAQLFAHGTSMYTSDIAQSVDALQLASKAVAEKGSLTCPYCKLSDLTEDGLWSHMPLQHINDPNISCKCPCCGKDVQNIFVHYHNKHGPVGRGEHPNENYPDTALYAFALVVCQRSDGRFLLVHEFANAGFWLPGGRVDPSEKLWDAAIRETKEEAGIDVTLTGVLRVEYSPHRNGNFSYVRMRVIFTAKPKDETQRPKSLPDYESVGASWVTMDEIKRLPLRGSEPLQFCGHVASGGPVYPMSLLGGEGGR